MLRPKIIEERIGVEPVKYPGFFEWNKLGCKIHIAFDGADPEGALDLIDEGLAILNYGQNAVLIHMEKTVPKKVVKMIKEDKK